MTLVQHPRVLIVDDEEFVGELVSRILVAEGYGCVSVTSGERAVECFEQNTFDLVFSDIMMPGMSGIDLLLVLKTTLPEVPVVMMSGVADRKTAIATLEFGAYGYVMKPFESDEILIQAAHALERRRIDAIAHDYETLLEQRVEERTQKLKEREDEIVYRLIAALNYRDGDTGMHARRIGLYSSAMAEALGWDHETADLMRLAGSMHDIGKIAITDAILLKGGPLTFEEFEVMKTHAVIGADMLAASETRLLQMAQGIAWCHHERWDGTGYPRGLAEYSIPESALIVAVLDVYDSLIHDRPYRQALPERDALAMMIAGNGRYFGDEVFDCFMSLLPELRRIRDEVEKET